MNIGKFRYSEDFYTSDRRTFRQGHREVPIRNSRDPVTPEIPSGNSWEFLRFKKQIIYFSRVQYDAKIIIFLI